VFVLWTTFFSLKRDYKKKAPEASPSKKENYTWLKPKKKNRIKEKAHNFLSALTILIEDISQTPAQNSHHKRYKLSGIVLL
jgi:hypothetical protein